MLREDAGSAGKCELRAQRLAARSALTASQIGDARDKVRAHVLARFAQLQAQSSQLGQDIVRMKDLSRQTQEEAGSAVEIGGYPGMFYLLSAAQAAGLIFALIYAPQLRSQVR